jgi:hypothetical protein
MHRKLSTTLGIVVLAAVVLCCWALVRSSDAVAGSKDAPAAACCNPAYEPGVGDNPLCYEGHTCCADGQWRCNEPDGSPSCAPGEVCEPGCGEKNDPCDVDEDCCSGDCKPNGRCK